MTDTIWMRKKLRETTGRANPYRGARYYADDFAVIPSAMSRSKEDIDAIAKKDYGPPENPVKTRN